MIYNNTNCFNQVSIKVKITTEMYTKANINHRWFIVIILFHIYNISIPLSRHLSAGLGGSVGCAVRLETRRSRVQPRRGRQHSFMEIDHEIFSTVILFPYADSRRTVVSFWRKNVHNTGYA